METKMDRFHPLFRYVVMSGQRHKLKLDDAFINLLATNRGQLIACAGVIRFLIPFFDSSPSVVRPQFSIPKIN